MIDLILQGKCDDYTLEIADHYSQLDWVNIIISCWYGDICTTAKTKYKTVISSKPLNHGLQNRNLQIVSSLNGLRQATSGVVAKLRSDQKISLDSLEVMRARAESNPNKIMVAGFYRDFPFHPRDHIFWGARDSVIDLFSIPLDEVESDGHAQPDAWPNRGFFCNNLRAEAYLCSRFLAKKDERVLSLIKSPQRFMHDFAPEHDFAMKISDELMDKYFAPFPKIDFEWPKHGLTNYHYFFAEHHYGEYWGT